MSQDTLLRALVDLRDRTLQKSRIAFGNRLSAIERGADQAGEGTQILISRWHDRFAELEAGADKDIAALAGEYEIVEQLVALKGIGLLLAGKLVSMIDIEKADTVSALWRFAGYAVIDGARERPVKGEKLAYNKGLKVTCYLIGTSFLRCGSPYRDVYDAARAYYKANRPDWTDGHQHNAAMRKMIKVFLSHLWERWREQEGLPTRKLYVQEKLGHDGYRPPTDFGWPSKDDTEGPT